MAGKKWTQGQKDEARFKREEKKKENLAKEVVPKVEPQAQGGHMQDIIDSKQAPGVHIPYEQRADYNPKRPDPNVPLDWSKRKIVSGGMRPQSRKPSFVD